MGRYSESEKMIILLDEKGNGQTRTVRVYGLSEAVASCSFVGVGEGRMVLDMSEMSEVNDDCTAPV